jgi:predicted 3-demethylubiquinone-9 3-methyltransferase (glyoxalase superfamily)
MMSHEIRPFLMFTGKAEEAMNFYVSLFPAAQVLDIARYGREEPGVEGSVKKAVFCIGGQTVMCTDSVVKHDFAFTPAFSL